MCQGLFDNTNAYTEHAYTVEGDILIRGTFDRIHLGLNPGSYLVSLLLKVNTIEIHFSEVKAVIRELFLWTFQTCVNSEHMLVFLDGINIVFILLLVTSRCTVCFLYKYVSCWL